MPRTRDRQEACEEVTEARVPRDWESRRRLLERWAGARCCGTMDHSKDCTCTLRVMEGH